MKKQFLILILALLAGTTLSFGQGAVKFSDPRPLVCDDDALHPVAGRVYTYEAIGTPEGGEWRFWSTKDPNFITTDAGVTDYNHDTALGIALDELIAHSANYNIPGSANTVDITWSSALLAGTIYQSDPTFVVAYYVGPDGCTDNIKVWELDPINGFTVDILSLDPNSFAVVDYDDPAPEQCADMVRGAIYAGGTMQYDYGTNYLYFEFVAANFSEYWIPTFNLIDLGPTQAVVTYGYTFQTPDTWATTPPTWTDLISGTTQIPIDPSVTDTELGVSVFVRVTVANNQFENIAGITLTMQLDGQNAEGIWDVRNEDCSLPDPNAADLADTAQQTITPRPEVQEGTTSPLVPNIEMVPGNNQN